MKIFKYLGLVFLFILGLNMVSAVVNNAQAYYSYDSVDTSGTTMIDISGNGKNATCTMDSNCDTVTGLLKQASDFDGTNDIIDTNSNLTFGTTWAISTWVKVTNNGYIMSTRQYAPTKWWTLQTNAGNYIAQLNNGAIVFNSGVSPSGSSYDHLVLTYDGSKFYYYVNNVLVNTQADTTTYSQSRVRLGGFSTAYLAQIQDETAFYTHNLTASDVNTLYNGGLAFDPYKPASLTYSNINLTSGTITNSNKLGIGINISAEETNTDINTTMYLNNGSSYIIGTSTQNVSYTLSNIQEGTYNIWFYSYNNETNVTSSNYTYIFDFTNPTLTNNIASEITSYTFSPASNISFSDSVGVDYCYFNVSNGQSALCNASTFTFNTNGNHTYNLTLKDSAGNIVSDNNNLVLVNPYQYFYFEDESSNPITDFTLGGTTYEDYANILTYNDGLSFGSNSLEFSKTGYLTQNINFNLNTTSAINNTYTVQNATITITIRYKQNSSIITGYNFTVEFIGTVGLVTTTTTGVVNVSNTLFQNENYRVVITNTDFFTESIFFDFNNQEQLSVDAYMLLLNDSKAGTVTIKVIDFNTQIVEGATVYALQWNSVTSKYEAVSQGTTGSDGQSVLNIILDDKVYIFTAEHNGNWANSTNQIISTSEDGKTVVIPLNSLTPPNTYLFQNLLTEIVEVYDNITNISTVYFSWQNLEGISSNICINVYREIGTQQTRIITNCTSGVAGSYVIANYLNSSYNLYVKGEVKIGNSYIPIKSFFHPARDSVSAFLQSLRLSIFILPLLVIAGISIGLFAENALIGTAFIIIFMGFGLTLAPDLLTKGIVAFIGFIGFLIIKYGRKAV